MKTINTISRAILLMLCASCFSCKHTPPINSNQTEPPSGTWQALGFEDKTAKSFSISYPYLYVAAREDGVWRRNIAQLSAEWEYLGLVSRDGKPGTYEGSVARVDVWGNDVLAGLIDPIEIEPDISIGVWRSVVDSKTWTPSDSGMRTPTFQWSGAHDIKRSPQNPQTVLAGAGDHYRSSDGGSSWQFVLPSRRGSGIPSLRFSWNPFNPLIVWGLGIGNRGEPSLRHSTDGGLSWQFYRPIRFLEQDALILMELAYDAGDANIVYLATSAGVFKSTNGGQNWLDDQETLTPILTDSTERGFIGIVTDSKQPGVFLTAAATRLYLTIDGGQSIFVILSPNKQDIISLAYDEQRNTLYLGALDGIFRLKDPLNAPRVPYE